MNLYAAIDDLRPILAPLIALWLYDGIKQWAAERREAKESMRSAIASGAYDPTHPAMKVNWGTWTRSSEQLAEYHAAVGKWKAGSPSFNN